MQEIHWKGGCAIVHKHSRLWKSVVSVGFYLGVIRQTLQNKQASKLVSHCEGQPTDVLIAGQRRQQ